MIISEALADHMLLWQTWLQFLYEFLYSVFTVYNALLSQETCNMII